jgi:hypothetical protein
MIQVGAVASKPKAKKASGEWWGVLGKHCERLLAMVLGLKKEKFNVRLGKLDKIWNGI